MARSGNSLKFMQRWYDRHTKFRSARPPWRYRITDTETILSELENDGKIRVFDGGGPRKARDNVLSPPIVRHRRGLNYLGAERQAVGLVNGHDLLPYAALATRLKIHYVVNQTLTVGRFGHTRKTPQHGFRERTAITAGRFCRTSPARVDDLNVAQVGINWNAQRGYP